MSSWNNVVKQGYKGRLCYHDFVLKHTCSWNAGTTSAFPTNTV